MTTRAMSLSVRRQERERADMMLSAIRSLARGLILAAAIGAVIGLGCQTLGWVTQVDDRIGSAIGTSSDSDRWVTCLRSGC